MNTMSDTQPARLVNNMLRSACVAILRNCPEPAWMWAKWATKRAAEIGITLNLAEDPEDPGYPNMTPMFEQLYAAHPDLIQPTEAL